MMSRSLESDLLIISYEWKNIITALSPEMFLQTLLLSEVWKLYYKILWEEFYIRYLVKVVLEDYVND